MSLMVITHVQTECMHLLTTVEPIVSVPHVERKQTTALPFPGLHNRQSFHDGFIFLILGSPHTPLSMAMASSRTTSLPNKKKLASTCTPQQEDLSAPKRDSLPRLQFYS